MKITQKHYLYYTHKKIKKIGKNEFIAKVSIHNLIPNKEKLNLDKHNDLQLLKMIRGNCKGNQEKFLNRLKEIVSNSGCAKNRKRLFNSVLFRLGKLS